MEGGDEEEMMMMDGRGEEDMMMNGWRRKGIKKRCPLVFTVKKLRLFPIGIYKGIQHFIC